MLIAAEDAILPAFDFAAAIILYAMPDAISNVQLSGRKAADATPYYSPPYITPLITPLMLVAFAFR